MSIAIRRILFPTDFSEPATHAQKYAMEFAERFGAELHVLHVIPPLPLPYPDSNSIWIVSDVDSTQQLHAAMKLLQQQFDAQWAEKHCAVLAPAVGFAVDEIVHYATKHAIDLIVVGTHGHTGFNRLLLGSVAEKLVRVATCPVLTVHPQGNQFAATPTEAESTSK